MTSAFSWQNSVSLCPASFCTPRPNLPVTPGMSWLPTFAFQSPIMKRTCELPNIQAGFKKRQMNQRSNCQHPLDHRKSKRVPEKHLLLLSWLRQSLWLCGSQQTVENSSRGGNTRPTDLPLDKSVCRSRSKLELDMEQQIGFKLGKEYVKAIYCQLAYLTYMQSTSCEMLG